MSKMNPPAALHGAMSRDRKPFTYTPGGLDLSEIKSQRMAQRLMRNAMNPGVPEISVNTGLPPSNPTAHVALPNFNCLPVQVFPAMPVNPKTLLRSRSNPDPKQIPEQRLNTSTFVNKVNIDNKISAQENNSTYSQQQKFTRPASMYEYCIPQENAFKSPNLNYGSEDVPVSSANVPVQSFVYTPVLAPVSTSQLEPDNTHESLNASVLPEISYEVEYCVPKTYNGQSCLSSLEEKISKETVNNEDLNIKPIAEASLYTELDRKVNVMEENDVTPTYIPTINMEENKNIDNEQREVKVIKKQVTKEKKVEEQNGKENGDTNEETEMTIKLPAKKSAAKTETKVEVEKRVLPDGSTEEVKTTTTTTTIDGRTEIKTKTETKITPKEVEYEEEVEEEEEEDGEEEVVEEVKASKEEVKEEPKTVTVSERLAETKQNGTIVTEEKSEINTTKKVIVIQDPEETEEVEEEEEETEEVDEEEAEPVTVILRKTSPETEIESNTENIEEEEKVIIEHSGTVENGTKTDLKEKKEEIEETDSGEEVEQDVEEVQKTIVVQDDQEEQENEEEVEEYEEAEEEKQDISRKEIVEEVKTKQVPKEKESLTLKEENLVEEKEEITSEISVEKLEKTELEEHVIPVKVCVTDDSPPKPKEEIPIDKPTECTIPIREPSIPLEKVEDVEIKPIGITPIITKTHTENTEIITNKIDPSGGISRQTEYNKIENIVTVNRTTKILDQNYEHMTQQGIPTVKTYFPPPNIDRISTSPMASRPYQSVYAPEAPTERRHSLLLERLSMERQMPSDLYTYNNQLQDQGPYQDEPQSEVLSVSNVKPSSITNQQWYQQTKQTQNVLYNNVTSTPTPVGAPWAQPKSPQPQQQYQPQPQYQPPSQPQYQPPSQPQYQPPPQPQFQRGTTPQPQFQRGTTPLTQYQNTAAPQPQYQSTYTEPTHDRTSSNNYSTFAPTPSWLGSNLDSKQNQYTYVNKDSTQNYQKSTINSISQQYSSDYVPPPWEQDSSYISVNNTSEKYYKEIPQKNTYNNKPSQSWTPAPPPAKFTKSSPIAYVPPAPNQSFVKTASNVEPPKQIPGRKTYYSEYERRYITVPESTYIPTETKFQPQPDPSPQYYYDNNEPKENVEPQWRRELREFTEKTSQTIEETNVPPPWEVDSKYAKTPSSTYTPTPTWSQTLRPQSYRKRSFESEFLSQEWPKTNTLGRGRPLSTTGKSLDGAVPERARGMSVDRYNPNNYQPPAEHPPVQSHTLTTPLPHASYHNPNVPAYHARASAEPREQPVNYQQRVYSRESRASPLQSRSFKYLQWITGTEN